jgi:protein PhnA
LNLENILQERSGGQCELCPSSEKLGVFQSRPKESENESNCAYLCEFCRSQFDKIDDLTPEHWRCLNNSMWSEHPVVQVLAYRMLSFLRNEGWAQDLLEQLYLDEENLAWAKEGIPEDSGAQKPTLDSNGNKLADGDSVTLIKDLDVKGAGFTAKRGTLVKKISITDDPTHIEGRVNGVQIFLKTCFLKKVVG